jgi:hypothetical protein
MDPMDVRDPRIERPIGDSWNRVPHFVVRANDDSPIGVLYIPTSNGRWSAQAFATVDDAARYLEQIYGPVTEDA